MVKIKLKAARFRGKLPRYSCDYLYTIHIISISAQAVAVGYRPGDRGKAASDINISYSLLAAAVRYDWKAAFHTLGLAPGFFIQPR